MNEIPIVSICSITYNQVRFVTQTIESILSQKVDFPIEIVIGDDASEDGTKEILIKYQQLYPDKIFLSANKENIGMAKNFLNTIGKCKGKYIVICEGDDYWIDKYKLHKQVNFLESHPECSICFHNVNIVDENGMNIRLFHPEKFPTIFTIEELALGNFIPTVSVMFRNNFIKYPEWILQLTAVDYPTHLINAQYGQIAYIPEIMAAYRENSNGVWSTLSKEHKYLNLIEKVLFKMVPHFEGNIKNNLLIQIDNSIIELFLLYISKGLTNKVSDFIERNRDKINFNSLLELMSKQLLEYKARSEMYSSSTSYKLGRFILNPLSRFNIHH